MMEDGLEVQQLLAALDASIGELPLSGAQKAPDGCVEL